MRRKFRTVSIDLNPMQSPELVLILSSSGSSAVDRSSRRNCRSLRPGAQDTYFGQRHARLNVLHIMEALFRPVSGFTSHSSLDSANDERCEGGRRKLNPDEMNGCGLNVVLSSTQCRTSFKFQSRIYHRVPACRYLVGADNTQIRQNNS